MWESFVVWGQSYGLWVTIGIMSFMLITDYVQNASLKKALEQTREEKKFYEDRYKELLGGDGNEPPRDHR